MRSVIKRLGKHWWIVSDDYGLIGPYNKRAEAVIDKQGLKLFFTHENEAGFVSCDGPANKE